MIHKRLLVTGALSAIVIAAAPVHAQNSANHAVTLAQLQEQLDQQQRALDAQRARLNQTRKQLDYLRQQMHAGQSQPASNQAVVSTSQGGKPEVASSSSGSQPATVGAAPADTQRQNAAKVAPVLDQPGVLTPKGHFVLEPSLQYAYSTQNRAALVGYTVIPAITIGLIDIRRLNNMSAVAALTARYGLTNRLELQAKVPYVYQRDQAVRRPMGTGSGHEQVFNSSGQGLGDIELALRYQFNDGGPDMPYFIGSLRGIFPTGKGPFDLHYSQTSQGPRGPLLAGDLPTGSGFYGLEAGVLAMYPSDPAVFYGGLSYLWNIARDVDKHVGPMYVGRVDPGDAISLNFGMGLSLNDRASFSIGYQHTYVQKTQYEGKRFPDVTDTQLGTLMLGYGYQLTPDTSLNVALGAGLTEDSPDMQLTVRVPMSF